MMLLDVGLKLAPDVEVGFHPIHVAKITFVAKESGRERH